MARNETTVLGKTEGDKKTTQSEGIWRRVATLAVLGGLAFWLTNFAISRTPIAAEYRAALSISYLSMLVESLIGGLIIGLFVSYFLLRFLDKIPTRNPILKSMVLCLIALVIVTMLIEGPSRLLAPTSDALRYFLIGTLFNTLRILALGIVIGFLYMRLYRGFKPSTIA